METKGEYLDLTNYDLSYKGYKIRIYPSEEQKQMFHKYFGMVRFVYNLGIDLCTEYYNENKDNDSVKHKTLSFISLRNKVSYLKNNDPNYSWLKDFSSYSIEIVCRDLINGYTKFFQRAVLGLPKRKRRKHANQSFPIRPSRMSITEDGLTMSSFDNNVIMKKVNPNLIGYGNSSIRKNTIIYKNMHHIKYANPRIMYDGVNYYLSVTVPRQDNSVHDFNSTNTFKYNSEWSNKPTGDVCGLDWGCKLSNWYVASNGLRAVRPNQSVLDKRIAGYQKKLQRQARINDEEKHIERTNQYYTNNELKTLHRLNKLYKKHTNQRLYLIHQFANKLIDSKPKALVFETIKTRKAAKDMSVYKAYMNKKTKIAHNLRLSIHDTSMNIIRYKAIANGIPVIMAPEGFKSTHVCSKCGCEHNIGTSRTFTCPNCGLVMDRDENSANVLKKFGEDFLNNL